MGHVPLEISFNALYMYNNLPILMWSLASLKIYLVGTPFPEFPPHYITAPINIDMVLLRTSER